MKLLTLWLTLGMTATVLGQAGNPLLSVIISDAVSIFTSVTSAVGSQVSAATATSDSTSSDGTSSATSTASTTTSSTSTSSSSSTTAAAAATSSAVASSASSNTKSSSHDRNLAIILGTVLGALVLGFLVLFLLLLCRRRRRRATADKRHRAYNSSSEDIVTNEKNLRHQRRSSTFKEQPTTFQNYHRGPQTSLRPNRYPSGIPAAHGMGDGPYTPGFSYYQHSGQMNDHERGMFLDVDRKHPDDHHHERAPLAGLGGAAPRMNGGYQRHSQAVSSDQDEYTHNLIQPPPRSPFRNSFDSTDRRRRSTSLSRDEAPTPSHLIHDPMPTKPANLANGALAGSALQAQREKRRSRSQPRHSAPVSSGLVSPIMKNRDTTMVHEMGDSSDDRDIERLRRTGTLSAKGRPGNFSELHELSSTGSSNAVPTLASMHNSHHDANAGYRQSYPPALNATAVQPATDLHPAPFDPAHWIHKDNEGEQPSRVPSGDYAYVNLESNPWVPHSSANANEANLKQGLTPPAQQNSNSGAQPVQGSLLVSGILKVMDQPSQIPQSVETVNRPPTVSRTSTEERRRSRAKRRSGSQSRAIVSNTEPDPLPSQPLLDHKAETVPPRPISQSNISQPLRAKPSQPQDSLISSQTTMKQDTHAPLSSNPPTEYHNISEPHFVGRWNSRGRWKSYEDIPGPHQEPGHIVGQAM